MSETKMKLIQRALDKHEKIFPCGDAALLEECFTVAEDRLLFWYNTEDDSTHLLEEVLN